MSWYSEDRSLTTGFIVNQQQQEQAQTLPQPAQQPAQQPQQQQLLNQRNTDASIAQQQLRHGGGV